MREGSDHEGEDFSIQPPFPSFDGSDNGLNTDTESSRQVGSTLAEALLPPPITTLQQKQSENSDSRFRTSHRRSDSSFRGKKSGINQRVLRRE